MRAGSVVVSVVCAMSCGPFAVEMAAIQPEREDATPATGTEPVGGNCVDGPKERV